ncbi:hypothetical protein L873DRAFT_1303633 [Choiromyces venosus 120613-1]|uniref:Uncharacterized protein n=1 Tax=Choiromyces venosus 120613-1 TaxID=1336337 RepID=A0A3N4JB84_9PEZI|nr:hypothetical protein L873DRAFT_1303633 [Choiromyces venosus 120613-1]
MKFIDSETSDVVNLSVYIGVVFPTEVVPTVIIAEDYGHGVPYASFAPSILMTRETLYHIILPLPIPLKPLICCLKRTYTMIAF